jgi:hypothetical protein
LFEDKTNAIIFGNKLFAKYEDGLGWTGRNRHNGPESSRGLWLKNCTHTIQHASHDVENNISQVLVNEWNNICRKKLRRIILNGFYQITEHSDNVIIYAYIFTINIYC